MSSVLYVYFCSSSELLHLQIALTVSAVGAVLWCHS